MSVCLGMCVCVCVC